MHPDTLRHYLEQAQALISVTGTAEEKAQADFYEVILLNRAGKTDSALSWQPGTSHRKMGRSVRNCAPVSTSQNVTC